MDSYRRHQIQENLRRIAATHVAAMRALEETSAMLDAEFAVAVASNQRQISASQSKSAANRPFVSRPLLSVMYRGKSCFLGNTLPLRLIERLLRAPNQYVSHQQLQEDVWNGVRSRAAVRSVVKELRAKLRTAGMAKLAEAIDGHVAGHYALFLPSGS
jgi:DNA-binding response OmpR family regulator